MTDFIHRWLPAKNRESARTIVLLHGTGGDEDDLIPLGKEIDPEANLLSPRGKVNENGMNRFFQRFPDGSFDVPDLKERTLELALFLEQSAFTYGFDPKKMWAAGYSNGANTIGSMLLMKPGLLAGAVMLRGTIPFDPHPQPVIPKTPVLILGGRNDTMIDPDGTQKMADLLMDCGGLVKLVWQPGGHGLVKDDLAQAKAFLAAH